MAYSDVGNRIRDTRKKAGITQEQLAELARLNRVTVAKYEAGTVEPGASALSRIADALDVTVDELLGRESTDAQEETESAHPLTPEARTLAAGVDRMSKEERERLLQMARLMFDYADYFDEKENADDPEP